LTLVIEIVAVVALCVLVWRFLQKK
jgi:hypothetical protein